MFTEKNLRELAEYQSQHTMLTIYLNTDPTMGNADSYRLRLRNMLKTVDLHDDVRTIEGYFETEYDWSGRSVVIFSDFANKFFKTYTLALPVADLVHMGVRPNLRPMAALLDSYGGYGVVLIDKQGARLFHFHLGELVEQEGVLGDIIHQIKKGGSGITGRRSGVASVSRNVEETIERNIRAAVDFSVRFFEEKNIRRILLSGTDDNIALFRGYLPKMWQSLVVGSFPSSMTASHQDILQKALNIGNKAEKEREKRLIDRLITQASKNAGAVMGVEPTLAALSEERIQMIVVQQGLKISGFRCPNCNRVTSLSEVVCKQCDSEAIHISDLASTAISLVIRQGGEVEIVHPNEAFEKVGGVGAFLRY